MASSSTCHVEPLQLQRRKESRGFAYEWGRLREELDDLQEVRAEAEDRLMILRTIPRKDAGKAPQAVGVALGPALRFEALPSG